MSQQLFTIGVGSCSCNNPVQSGNPGRVSSKVGLDTQDPSPLWLHSPSPLSKGTLTSHRQGLVPAPHRKSRKLQNSLKLDAHIPAISRYSKRGSMSLGDHLAIPFSKGKRNGVAAGGRCQGSTYIRWNRCVHLYTLERANQFFCVGWGG